MDNSQITIDFYFIRFSCDFKFQTIKKKLLKYDQLVFFFHYLVKLLIHTLCEISVPFRLAKSIVPHQIINENSWQFQMSENSPKFTVVFEILSCLERANIDILWAFKVSAIIFNQVAIKIKVEQIWYYVIP